MSYDNYNPWNGRSYINSVETVPAPYNQRNGPPQSGLFALRMCLIMTVLIVTAIIGIVIAIVVPIVVINNKSDDNSSPGENNGGNDRENNGGNGGNWKTDPTGCSASGPPFKGLDYVYRNFGPLWERKVKTFSRELEFEHTGQVTKQSFLILAQRGIDFAGLDETSAKQMLLKFGAIFDNFFGEFAVNGGVDEVTYGMAVRKNQIYLRDAATQFYAFWFDVMDRDADNIIHEEDFKIFFRMFVIDESLAPDTFKALDIDHDGKIMQEEFTGIGDQFWLTEDESNPTNMLHGPLAE